jgi:hypothetical protein
VHLGTEDFVIHANQALQDTPRQEALLHLVILDESEAPIVRRSSAC